jgi:hypothetical protein
MTPPVITAWHAIVKSRDEKLLAEILDENCIFRSPAVHAPQKGHALSLAYLTAAMKVLGPRLRYLREWYRDDGAVLEFETELDGKTAHGVDLIQWNAAGKIVDFAVMVRPLRGLEAVIAHMGKELAGATR